MIIKTTTTRVINEEDFDEWIKKLIEDGVPIDKEEFLSKRKFTHECDLGYTKARTEHELILA